MECVPRTERATEPQPAAGEAPRRGLLTALWDELLGEVTELRAAQGEEWAEEGAMHVHRCSAVL